MKVARKENTIEEFTLASTNLRSALTIAQKVNKENIILSFEKDNLRLYAYGMSVHLNIELSYVSSVYKGGKKLNLNFEVFKRTVAHGDSVVFSFSETNVITIRPILKSNTNTQISLPYAEPDFELNELPPNLEPNLLGKAVTKAAAVLFTSTLIIKSKTDNDNNPLMLTLKKEKGAYRILTAYASPSKSALCSVDYTESKVNHSEISVIYVPLSMANLLTSLFGKKFKYTCFVQDTELVFSIETKGMAINMVLPLLNSSTIALQDVIEVVNDVKKSAEFIFTIPYSEMSSLLNIANSINDSESMLELTYELNEKKKFELKFICTSKYGNSFIVPNITMIKSKKQFHVATNLNSINEIVSVMTEVDMLTISCTENAILIETNGKEDNFVYSYLSLAESKKT